LTSPMVKKLKWLAQVMMRRHKRKWYLRSIIFDLVTYKECTSSVLSMKRVLHSYLNLFLHSAVWVLSARYLTKYIIRTYLLSIWSEILWIKFYNCLDTKICWQCVVCMSAFKYCCKIYIYMFITLCLSGICPIYL